jgi:hypothetical protein
VLKLLRSLIPGATRAGAISTPASSSAPPSHVVSGAHTFPLASHLRIDDGFPRMDWEAAGAWVDALPDDAARRAAWDDLERAWLAHLRSALGPDYRLRDTDDAMLLSTLDPGLADATLAFMAKTLRRIVHVLEGIGRPPHEGKSILVLMDDADTYYRYVARHYDTGGESRFPAACTSMTDAVTSCRSSPTSAASRRSLPMR